MGLVNENAESPVREQWFPSRDDVTIYGVLAALSDPTRLEVVRRLAEGERSPIDFLALGSKQNLTHHCKVLRESGLIQWRYDGRNKFMWLRRDLIDELFPGLLDGLFQAVAADAERG